MRIRETIAASAAVLFFAVIYGIICWPLICGIRFFGWLLRYAESDIRSAIARHAHWWGRWIFSAVRILLRMDVDVRLEGERALLHERPGILIANHQSTLDIVAMAYVMHLLGVRNVRWVLKEKLRRRSLMIGWMAERIGCAFVTRQDPARDLDAIRRCAVVMREDCASVILFPEGTRFSPRKRTDAYRNLLPPKTTGFRMFRDAFPNAAVVSVTIHWSPPLGADGKTGRTIFHGADFYGKTLHMDIRIAGPDEVRADPMWLAREWERKDRWIAEHLA